MEKSLEKHLMKIYKGEDLSEVLELICDQFKMSELSPKDKECLEKFTNVDLLTFNFCGLKSLNNLPMLDNVEIVH